MLGEKRRGGGGVAKACTSRLGEFEREMAEWGGEGESEMAEKEWGKREEKYSMERTGDTRVVLVHFFVYMYSLCSCFLAFFFFFLFSVFFLVRIMSFFLLEKE